MQWRPWKAVHDNVFVDQENCLKHMFDNTLPIWNIHYDGQIIYLYESVKDAWLDAMFTNMFKGRGSPLQTFNPNLFERCYRNTGV